MLGRSAAKFAASRSQMVPKNSRGDPSTSAARHTNVPEFKRRLRSQNETFSAFFLFFKKSSNSTWNGNERTGISQSSRVQVEDEAHFLLWKAHTNTQKQTKKAHREINALIRVHGELFDLRIRINPQCRVST